MLRTALEWTTPDDEKVIIDLTCVVGAREEGVDTVVMLNSGHSVQLRIRYWKFARLLADHNWEILSEDGDEER